MVAALLKLKATTFVIDGKLDTGWQGSVIRCLAHADSSTSGNARTASYAEPGLIATYVLAASKVGLTGVIINLLLLTQHHANSVMFPIVH